MPSERLDTSVHATYGSKTSNRARGGRGEVRVDVAFEVAGLGRTANQAIQCARERSSIIDGTPNSIREIDV